MRRRLRLMLLPPVVLIAGATVLPASAAAAGVSGLHVDPASPVAKAYALPLGSAGGATPGGRGRSLFGSGITRAGSAKPAAYRLPRPGPGIGLALMGLVALLVLVIGAAGAVALSHRR